MAEADGNRTRLTEHVGHYGFEDRGGHQAPDASLNSSQHEPRFRGRDQLADHRRARHLAREQQAP